MQEIHCKLVARHRLNVGMMTVAVCEVSLVVGHAEDGAQNPRNIVDNCENLTHCTASGCNGTLDGKFRSKSSNIRRYSSVHDDGRRKA